MAPHQRFDATRREVEALIRTLNRAYPIEDQAGFEEALKAIDEAEQQIWKDSEAASEKAPG